MQNYNIKNILIQAMNPNKFFVMLKKLGKRVIDKGGHHTKNENLTWLKSQQSDFKELAISLDAALWDEAEKTSKIIDEQGAKVLEDIEYNLGGGGAHPFLFFITRYMEPDCIVETGVAAGFSSYAFLLAIKTNGKGKLYSSDFPYFRIPDPEKYIGIVVEKSLKNDWALYLDGDEINLPKIARTVNKVDIFHYDSDKSHSGRRFAVTLISKLLSSNGVIVMDDIQDNSYFYDYVENNHPESWCVFEFEGKYVGMIGKLTRRCT
ncbi:class I SAM-dependent methyltransferase [Oceanospirillaceae bacterium]|nr:class I SAM-dependent methyltransferase [Oceanospirillaceae bacterium]